MPRVIPRIYTLSLHKKSNLGQDLVSWRGQPFTSEEEKGFDIHTVLGANCLLTIVHTEKDGSTYANIAAVTKLVKGMPKKEPENPIIKYSMEEDGWNVPENVYDWIKDKIADSMEVKAVKKAAENDSLAVTQEKYGQMPDGSVETEPVDNEDIPF